MQRYICKIGEIDIIMRQFAKLYMGTFPDRQHYFAAAGENRDIGSLWRGPFLIGRILFSLINKIQVWRRSDLTKKIEKVSELSKVD